MAACPSQRTLARLLAGELAGADLAAVEEHVEDCAVCQDVLEQQTAAGPTRRAAAPATFLRELMRRPPPPGYRSSRTAPGPPGDAHLPFLPGYELLAELGRGVSGVVYRACEIATGRLVAVKWSRARSAGPSSARFRREVEALALLRHPGLVRVFAVGEHLGRPFCAMELVEGGSLDRRLGRGPLPVEEAARLVAALARAVHAAHVQGWVHRDLKPANILLSVASEPKVADFGLAKHREDVLRHTRCGAVVGTPSYMAPEQAHADGREVGPRADVYALGAILYECLTGRPPFEGPGVPALLEQVRTQPPVPPRRLRPDVPELLQEVCLACLAKDAGQRPCGADVLAETLERLVQRPRPTASALPLPGPARPPRVRPGRTARRTFALLLLGAVTLTFAIGALATRRTDREARGERSLPPVPVSSRSVPVERKESRRQPVIPPPTSPVTASQTSAGSSAVGLRQTAASSVQVSVDVEGGAAAATVTVIDSKAAARSRSR